MSSMQERQIQMMTAQMMQRRYYTWLRSLVCQINWLQGALPSWIRQLSLAHQICLQGGSPVQSVALLAAGARALPVCSMILTEHAFWIVLVF